MEVTSSNKPLPLPPFGFHYISSAFEHIAHSSDTMAHLARIAKCTSPPAATQLACNRAIASATAPVSPTKPSEHAGATAVAVHVR